MFARISLLLLTAFFSHAALAETTNGNWMGTGTVDIVNGQIDNLRQSNNVSYIFEQTADHFSLKSCNYLFSDGSFVACSPFTAEIRAGGTLWWQNQQVGTISDSALNVAMAVNGFKITIQAAFAQAKMSYQYQSVSSDGTGKLVMKADLVRP
jgi:hypothetical protein